MHRPLQSHLKGKHLVTLLELLLWQSLKSLPLSIYLSHSLADHWGTTVDFTTSFLHFLWFLAFSRSIFHSRPVHSLMLTSHCFLCLPLRLPLWTVRCRIVLASPDDCLTCPYHFSLRLFTEVRNGGHRLWSGMERDGLPHATLPKTHHMKMTTTTQSWPKLPIKWALYFDFDFDDTRFRSFQS